MPSAEVERLRRLLEEAREVAALVGEEPRTEPPGTGYFSDPGGALRRTIEQLASHEGEVTMFVGAGVSTEAGLPSWHELVEGLLVRVGDDLDEEDRKIWLASTLTEGPLAAAAISKALHGDENEFRRTLRSVLYRDERPSAFAPGALAGQIAWLKQRLGPRLQLLTANYDGLLEAALAELGLDHDGRAYLPLGGPLTKRRAPRPE